MDWLEQHCWFWSNLWLSLRSVISVSNTSIPKIPRRLQPGSCSIFVTVLLQLEPWPEYFHQSSFNSNAIAVNYLHLKSVSQEKGCECKKSLHGTISCKFPHCPKSLDFGPLFPEKRKKSLNQRTCPTTNILVCVGFTPRWRRSTYSWQPKRGCLTQSLTTSVGCVCPLYSGVSATVVWCSVTTQCGVQCGVHLGGAECRPQSGRSGRRGRSSLYSSSSSSKVDNFVTGGKSLPILCYFGGIFPL